MINKSAEEQSMEYFKTTQNEVIDDMAEWQMYRFAIEALEEKMHSAVVRDVSTINNFEKLRIETASMEGMAKMFCSSSWEGTGRVFSIHAGKYMDSMDEAIQAEVNWLSKEE